MVDHEGHILTNAHVVAAAPTSASRSPTTRTVPARVVGKDEATDLALLEVDPTGCDLQPLELGDSAPVQVGDPTIAIGNLGLDRTLTTGVVSAMQRRIPRPTASRSTT